MEQRDLARPQVQPSADQLRATRETLEELGVPSDATAQENQAEVPSIRDINLTQTNVQPSAGVMVELARHSDQQEMPPDEHNNHDGAVDVLPR